MHKRTHLRIAIMIKRAVEKELGVKLSTRSFLYGNIKPDISYRMLKTLHCKHKSFNFIKNEINEIIEFPIRHSSDYRGEFSRRLGIITHFISDFFCQSHNKSFEGGLKDHFLYEYKLDSYFKDKSAADNSFVFDAGFEDSLINSSIPTFVDELHNEYMKDSKSCHNDISYSLKACITTAVWIISLCMQNELEPAA